MKLFSPTEEPHSAGENVQKEPAPYNLLVMLAIFIAYIVFTLLV